jgi:hypothetical protein
VRDPVGPVFAALSDPNRRHLVGLVEASRRGRNTHYRLTPDRIADALSWVERVGDEWDARLAALRSHLSSSPRERP